MDEDTHTRAGRANGVRFPAAEPSYRTARLRCAQACALYNGQAECVSPERRARLWQEIVAPRTEDAPPLLTNESHFENPIGQKRTPSTDDTTHSRSHSEATKPAPANGSQADDARTPHSSVETKHPHLVHTTDVARLGPSARPSTGPQSPPPSPEFVHVPPVSHVSAAEPLVEYAITNTPPPSRRTSKPHLLSAFGKDEDLDQPGSDPATTNPFLVKAPYIKPPLWIDYGTNLDIAPSTFINRNFVVIDSPVCRIRVGERCLFGPNITLAAVQHPLDAEERSGPLGAPSIASSIEIGDDCWLGAGVLVLCGVKIGSGCVIGAGSVVTRDIPSGTLAFGNPARVERVISSGHYDPTLSKGLTYTDSLDKSESGTADHTRLAYPGAPDRMISQTGGMTLNIQYWKDVALIMLSLAAFFALVKGRL